MEKIGQIPNFAVSISLQMFFIKGSSKSVLIWAIYLSLNFLFPYHVYHDDTWCGREMADGFLEDLSESK